MMSVSKISKLVVANRGEIACRVMRTARKLGIRTVTVFSEADRNALHVRMADEAYCIGPPPSQQSYLNADKILSVAKRSGAQAIHPGYGFLSENAEFAELCQKNGVTFVGPPPSAIRDMGIKNKCKDIMSSAGVPVIQGYHGALQTDDLLAAEAARIGYPVMIKAVRGGGGKGMRIAMGPEQFADQLGSARREAMKSFNDDAMLIEKFIKTPRHVEVQVFGDQHSNYVYLWERDCSVQRRHQKIIEEAPGPDITPETRVSLGEAAVKAARAVSYVGAGTVEFILNVADHKFYFMEMNTRLQVEHPVTEMITGTDLVEWQLRVAAGEPLPLSQDQIPLRGHAVEARIYAEDCSDPSAMMPTAGPIHHLVTPAEGHDLRIDTGVVQGDVISVHYDPMIAKLVVWADDRPAALRRLLGALRQYQVVGVPTNIEFLQRLASHPEFAAGHVHTNFIQQHLGDLRQDITPTSNQDEIPVKAAIGLILLEARQRAAGSGNDLHSPYRRLVNFRVNSSHMRTVVLRVGDSSEVPITVEYGADGCGREFVVQVADKRWSVGEVELVQEDHNTITLRLSVDGVKYRLGLVQVTPDEVVLFEDGRQHVVRLCRKERSLDDGSGQKAAQGPGHLVSPMPGVIDRVLVQPGQDVTTGQPVLTLIAMKMEYTVRADRAGRVGAVEVKEGQTVARGDRLADIQA